MNLTRIAAALTLSFAFHDYACADNAPITGVTLYSGSATVERSAPVKAGMTELEIGGLPANFDGQTIRVQASNGIQVGQIVVHDVGKQEAASAREAELDAKIQSLKDSRDVLNVDLESAALVKGYLANLNGGDRGQAQPTAAVIDTIKRSGHDALAQMQRIQVQMRDIDKKIAVLQGELNKVRSGVRDQRSITIAIAAHQAGSVKLSYQVNRAGWKPAYRATLNSTTSVIELERMAVVSQKTGEDWSGVDVKLSTGQPRLSPQAPDPSPLLLTYSKPQPMADYRMVTPAPVAAPMMLSGSRSVEESYIPPVMESQNTFDTEFAVPGRVNLASDGREITLSLSHQNLQAKQRVRIVPRQDKFAVVTAEAERPAGVWLNGNVQLFRDGAYVGAAYWNAQASDKLQLSFGRDDLIRVTVDRAGQQSGSAGFLSQRGERQVKDLFTISSLHKSPVDVLVLEASPVSTSDEIKVQKTFTPQPGITAWEQRQGIVGWEKSLAPSESMKIDVGYTIAYPKDGSVSGMSSL